VWFQLTFCFLFCGHKQLIPLEDLIGLGKKIDFFSLTSYTQDKPEIKRILTPHEKSAGDYFLAGGNLREWLEDCLNLKKVGAYGQEE